MIRPEFEIIMVDVITTSATQPSEPEIPNTGEWD